MIRRPFLFVAIACAGSLSCHRSVSEETPPPAAVLDAAVSSFPDPMADLTPSTGMVDAGSQDTPSQIDGSASDVGSDFHLRFEEGRANMGETDIMVVVDTAGNVFARTDKPSAKARGCSTTNIGKAGVAKLSEAAQKYDFFSLNNGYDGPTSRGLTRVRIRSDGREKVVVHRGPILFDPNAKDIDERKRIDAIEKTIQSVTGSESLPLGKCSSDLFSHLNF